MGTQQQFCLRWNNHQSNMLSVFDDLFQNEALVDVTLACDGLSIKAHKMVLSACSPYFQTLFLDNPCKHPIVILKDIRFSDLKALMDFMYKGEVNVSQDQLTPLLKTAETLKVRGLTEVAGGTDLHNSLLAQQHGQPQLAQQQQQQQPQLPPRLSNQTPQTAPHPSSSQQPQQQVPPHQAQTPQSCSSGPPSPKRKKARHRHKSDRSTSQSEPEDSDSPDLIEPKVEITEDSLDDERLGVDSKLRLQGGQMGAGASPAGNGNEIFSSNGTQGVSSAHEANPKSETQNFTGRPTNMVLNTTPPLLFSPPAPSAAVQQLAPVQTIGQPPVLQGTSQGRERHVRKWNEATLAEAMEAVRSRKLSIIAACRQYEIPWGTLYRRLSLANIRSAYSRNDHGYSHFLNIIPQLVPPAGTSAPVKSGAPSSFVAAAAAATVTSTTAAATTASTTSAAPKGYPGAPNISWGGAPIKTEQPSNSFQTP